MSARIFEDTNTARRKLIGGALREATSIQLLKVRDVIESQVNDMIGLLWILREPVEEALKLFDKKEYEHPKVCFLIVLKMDEFTKALSK
ncbi:MAG: hypothetical protein Q7K16_01115 [Candidatus Azambacteria bacterium]|nr:hypothetical protein [Candidatus Azambacteria bacterium]